MNFKHTNLQYLAKTTPFIVQDKNQNHLGGAQKMGVLAVPPEP